MKRLLVIAMAVAAAGCSDDDGATTPAGSTFGSASDDGADSTSSTTAMGDSGSTSSQATGGAFDGVLLRTTFTIPAGTVVEEFSFTAEGTTPDVDTAGRTVVVAIRDVSHPMRDHESLCPGNHPLNGCATVDYGAFGMTHDNRVAVEGGDGAVELHLFKDRSIQPGPEDLPQSE